MRNASGTPFGYSPTVMAAMLSEPHRLEMDGAGAVGGGLGRELEEVAHRVARALLLDVDAGAADGQDAALGVVAQRAVLALAAAQPGDAEAERASFASASGTRPARLGSIATASSSRAMASTSLARSSSAMPRSRRARQRSSGSASGPSASSAARASRAGAIAEVEVLLRRALLDLAQQREHLLVAGGAALRRSRLSPVAAAPPRDRPRAAAAGGRRIAIRRAAATQRRGVERAAVAPRVRAETHDSGDHRPP